MQQAPASVAPAAVGIAAAAAAAAAIIIFSAAAAVAIAAVPAAGDRGGCPSSHYRIFHGV